MTYLEFALKEKRLLSFAVSFTFFSSFGQTFLISLFVPFYLSAFELTNTSFGVLYSAATLGSAFVLPYLGQWIDRIPLRRYSMAVAIGLSFSSVLMAISWHVSMLFLSLFLLRLLGQGLSGHTAQTTMARFYDHQRGKALSISSMGFPLGEGILPIAIAGILTIFHWRITWGIIAGLIAFVLIPLLWKLVNKSHTVSEKEEDNRRKRSTWESYKIILSDKRLLFVIPATLLPPFWVTGLFLYQVSTAEQLGWTAAIIASSFIAFAGARISFGLIAGPWVDRFSAQQVFPFYLIPMVIGLLIGSVYSQTWSAFIYMGLLGASMGMGGTIKSALWAEMFGTGMIGTVRSLFSSIMVLSTAISPFLIGWWLDIGMTMPAILQIALFSTIAGGLLSVGVVYFDEGENGVSTP
ncbi:MAG: MFS transporter [Balneolaceae bacterium]